MRIQARERVVRTDNCKMLRGLIMKLIGLLLIKHYHDVDIDVLYETLDKTDYNRTSMARTPLET